MNSNKKPYVIGISGGSGSGKTSFIRDLKSQIAPDVICVISLDDYYKPREAQKLDERGIRNFDLPEAFRKEDFIRDLRTLISGNTVQIKEYTFNNSDKEAKPIKLQPAPVIIVEGLFALNFLEGQGLCDLSVFIHAHPVNKVVRRVNRDRIERNYPLEDVLYRYVNHVNPAYEQYIAKYKEEADIVINNNDSYDTGLTVLKAFILSL